MYGDSSLVVIVESSFKIGRYFINYDLQALYTSTPSNQQLFLFFSSIGW